MPKLNINNVIIGTTDMCNSKCIICPPRKDAGNVMDMDLFKHIIDTVHDNKCTNQIGFGLFNEPLTDPMLLDRLRYCKDTTRNETMLSTNAGLLTPDKFEEIRGSVDKYLVSFHAFDQFTYGNMTRTLDFERVRDNVLHLLDNHARVNIATVTTTENVDSYLKFADFWADQGAKVERYRLSNRCGGFDNELFKKLSFKPGLGNCDNSILKDLVVDWNGDVLMCCQDFTKANVLGNMTSNTLEDIRSGMDFKAVEKCLIGGKYSELICKHCLADPYNEELHAW